MVKPEQRRVALILVTVFATVGGVVALYTTLPWAWAFGLSFGVLAVGIFVAQRLRVRSYAEARRLGSRPRSELDNRDDQG